MNETIHCCAVRAPARAVFDIVADVRKWPHLFPPCKQVVVTREEPGYQKFRITAEANGSLMTWSSERWLDQTGLSVSFRQTEPQYPVTGMEGTWRCTADGPCQTTLVLTHRLAVADGPDHDANLQRMLGAIHANSARELTAIKEVAGRSKVYTFEDERIIPADADLVFDLLYRAENWPTLLPHCPALSVLYDDGRNQELLMTVETPAGREEIRTVRVAERPHALRYFQTLPPYPLRTHEGVWVVRHAEAGVLVTGAHTVSLIGPLEAPDNEDVAHARVEQAIRRNTQATLDSLNTYCQQVKR